MAYPGAYLMGERGLIQGEAEAEAEAEAVEAEADRF